MNDYNHVKTSSYVGLNLCDLGIITWIVFMILDYGYHVEWLNQYNPHPHFWTWFPLWAPCAIGLGFFIIGCIFIGIVMLIESRE